MSRPTTWAPSRASTRAIAAPMPREAPVTSATLPCSGRSQSSSRMALGRGRRSGRPGRRRRPSAARAGSAASSRSGPRRRGRRRRAARSRRCGPPCRPSGRSPRAPAAPSPRAGVAAVLGRGAEHDHAAGRLDPADRRVEEVASSSRSAVESAIPVASKTSALKRCVGRRLRVPDAGVEAGVADARRGPRRRARCDVGVGVGEHRGDRRRSRPPGAAPSRTSPLDQRLRPARSGRARPAAAGRRCPATKPPIRLLTSCE